MPFSLLFFNFEKINFKARLLHWIGWSFITLIIAEIFYNSLRLSQYFYIIGRKNLEFIRPLSEILKNPLEFSVSNFHALTQWVYTYMGPILFLMFLLGLAYGFFKKRIPIIYMAVLIFAPFFAEVIFNKILYARFALFYFPYIIITLSYGIVAAYDKISKYRIIFTTLILIGLSIPVYSSLMLLINPPKANIPDNDKNQYINDWPAGYGVSEIVSILKRESKNNIVYVGTEGTFGLYPYSLMVYFYGNNNIHITGYWPVNTGNLPQQVIEASKNHKTYFIYNFTQTQITDKHARFVEKFQKGSGNSFMRLYQVEYDR